MAYINNPIVPMGQWYGASCTPKIDNLHMSFSATVMPFFGNQSFVIESEIKPIMKLDKERLKEFQKALPMLNELDLLNDIWNRDQQIKVFEHICDKYLILEGDELYSNNSKRIKEILPYIIEWFGEDYALAIKDKKYIMLCLGDMDENDLKYWSISKLNVKNQKSARKIAFLIKFTGTIYYRPEEKINDDYWTIKIS